MKRKNSGSYYRYRVLLIALVTTTVAIGWVISKFYFPLVTFNIDSSALIFTLLISTLIVSVIVTLVQNKKLRQYIRHKKNQNKPLPS